MHVITDIREHDNKRNKVILDEGGLAFLLYKGECRKLGLRVKNKVESSKKNLNTEENEPEVISDEKYCEIMELLLLRAKKRALYYLKDEDKTEFKIREKLKTGLYPAEIIEKVIEYLRENHFSDDSRYAECFVEEQRRKKSKKEIEAKLFQRGVKKDEIKKALAVISREDEFEAAEVSLRKCTSKDPYAFLMRKGFPGYIIEELLKNTDRELY